MKIILLILFVIVMFLSIAMQFISGALISSFVLGVLGHSIDRDRQEKII